MGNLAFTNGSNLEITKKTNSSSLDPIKNQKKVNELKKFFQLPDLASLIRKRIENGYGYGNTSNSLLSNLN